MRTMVLSVMAVCLTASADVRLPQIFGDNMILQQKTSNAVWGFKAILASLPLDQRKEICSRLDYEKLTDNTIGSSKSMFKHLEQVGRKGYAMDDEEYIIGVRCLAAPVPMADAGSNHVGAIGFTAATVRFSKKQMPKFSRIIRESAAELTRAFQTHHINRRRITPPPPVTAQKSPEHRSSSRFCNRDRVRHLPQCTKFKLGP